MYVCEYLICVFCGVYQGLGLLINLVEYSSRNRHCLVDMEYNVDDTCLEDSLMQPADPTQSDTSAESAETRADTADKPKSCGALAALVKVGTVPELIHQYLSVTGCGSLLSFCLKKQTKPPQNNSLIQFKELNTSFLFLI